MTSEPQYITGEDSENSNFFFVKTEHKKSFLSPRVEQMANPNVSPRFVGSPIGGPNFMEGEK